jgi:hypothetical protein
MTISERGRAMDQKVELNGGCVRILFRELLTWKPMLE